MARQQKQPTWSVC